MPGVQGRAAISTRRVAFRGLPQGDATGGARANYVRQDSEFTAGHGTRIVLEETLQIRDSVREAINDMEVSTRDLPLLAGMALLSGYCLNLPSCDWKSF